MTDGLASCSHLLLPYSRVLSLGRGGFAENEGSLHEGNGSSRYGASPGSCVEHLTSVVDIQEHDPRPLCFVCINVAGTVERTKLV